MSKITMAKAEKLSEFLGDIEDAVSRVSDSLDVLTESDVESDEREDESESFADALVDLVNAVGNLDNAAAKAR